MSEIYAHRSRWNGGVEIFRFQNQGHRRTVAKPVEFVEVDDVASYVEPVMHLDKHSTQMLMDELWNCGFRPSEGSGSAGALAATQNHLEDMRKLVFKSNYTPVKK